MLRTSWRVLTTVAVLGLLGPADRAWAQAKTDKDKADDKSAIPAAYLPPAGMCRLWVDGVPPAQQPAPTDCATAVRNKPANGRVIYGPDKAKSGGSKLDELPINRLKPGARKGPPLIPPDLSQADPRARDAWEQKKITDAQLYGDQPAMNSPASSYPGGAPSPQGPMGSSGGYVTPGGVVVPGAVTDPRYFAPGARPPGFGSSVCLDRDEDGWCDDQRFGPPVCTDRDKDGRCDDLPEFASRAYPQVLPAMRSALDVMQGRPSTEVMQWLGTNEFVLRIPDQGRGGIPWRAIFLDGNGALQQVWTDVNRDGRADRVEVFRNGERVKLIQR
ncbi:MAG: hypothetical protein ACK6DP_05465 [Gemmatimonas sp.]|jgi:hypothetical protein|uniref:hypothetical protein n=1 Tax=Gemmatimonas sp. TaxID=1962908 RepID=UPI00391F311E|nr:hypothetical protein [Gemmatimonadota bacterium]